MGCQLIVTEKPKVAEKIAYSLGRPAKKNRGGVPYYELDINGKHTVVAPAVGHVFTLAEKGNHKWNLDYPVFELEWVPIYAIEKGASYTKKYIENLKILSKGCDEFINSCDYDVEGSVIGYNVLVHAANVDPKKGKVRRMHFSTITTPDLKRAYENLEPFDSGQTNAGLTRHVLDWYYGINLSRALTRALRSSHMRGTLSIGRVQGPSLKLIVDRELEIEKFVPEPYWVITALMDFQKLGFEGIHKTEKFWKEDEAKDAYSKCKDKKEGIVKSVVRREYKQPAPNPFDLTTLQVECHRYHRISPKETLEIGQSLYEAGLISYPRTSSQQLPPAIGYKSIINRILEQKEYAELAKMLLKEDYLKPNNGKKTDPAHPAIYPTGEKPEKLNAGEARVYDLIVHRFLATFGKPAVRESMKVETDIGGETFVSEGKRTVEKNWHVLYGRYADFEEITLPDLKEKDGVDVKKVDLQRKETQPPKRYTPASIISELEKRNLGTKSTRAVIIETLYNREYIEGSPIKATALGIKTVETLQNHSPEILDENLTKEFEEDMEKVVEGKKEGREIEKNAEKILIKISEKFKKDERIIGDKLAKATIKTEIEENSVGKCPVCGEGVLMIRFNPKTKKRFLGCSTYPKCSNTQPLPQKGNIQATDKTCPSCNYPMVNVWTKGKKIPWVICTNIGCPTKKSKS
ncbi:MAG: DNA topoisomerase I [Candidatus Altiarchaeota archaeon]|nr:DNA topoisomerase I [Candidatus Altiarchaeota archaeon]